MDGKGDDSKLIFFRKGFIVPFRTDSFKLSTETKFSSKINFIKIKNMKTKNYFYHFVYTFALFLFKKNIDVMV